MPVRVDNEETTSQTDPLSVDEGLIFSTEASNRTLITTDATDLPAGLTATVGPGVTVSVAPPTNYVAASIRGASNRAKVSVTDQYGDPITGARVSLISSLDTGMAPATDVVIGGGRALAVGRDGSHTFGYTRVAPANPVEGIAVTETLTPGWDHDSDGCSAADVAQEANPGANPPVLQHRCNVDGDTDNEPGIAGPTATVEWAAAASAAVTDQDQQQVREFDTETNTVFAGDTGEVYVLSYDSNDRFDLVRTVSASEVTSTSTYAGFERALSMATGYTLTWSAIQSGTRSINTFTLTIPS